MPEAATIAHDVAFYCLRGTSSTQKTQLPFNVTPLTGLSPRSMQNVASDAGMAMDAQLSSKNNTNINKYCETSWEGNDQSREGEALSISFEEDLVRENTIVPPVTSLHLKGLLAVTHKNGIKERRS
ncbi:ethylene-responsive transcription factor ERF019-like [Olea europaea var. sylvestris]|uniref:ethylene-responsive transcription factor ERF019-like n=1 Tax=Olea europaea var. sylvestris TaxID=158386 RepID=UPI000C1D3E09|nr:ethylene-responsive transcription factor ERF019-like [Olea europaea var. sylvestris]